MCILCVIQKWSRQVATMLPWLVIPLIGLWALSQLLPPAFRFEITSPRLACVFVLLVTLFWYEILMPQLSSWRVRRNTRLREKKRFEAIELQKLRKTATRRCRNCLTPYRDQNPGGGKFMCSYCGHISKRPVLDLPVPHGMGISNSGIIKGLVGKGGKILNGKVWSDNGWLCNGQDWLENGNWGGGSFAGKSAYWRKNGGGGFLGAEDDCVAENSYLHGVNFFCKLLMYFFINIKWLWRKVFRLSSSGEDSLSNDGENGVSAKNGENGANLNESRSDKARRKAEEKRQARLEKELLEEEERKQREEVARLVEECRRLRDVKVESEKDKSKVAASVKDRDCKKEAERKRQERKRDKDKGSSKSNSDVEELEKKVSKENDRKREPERKSDADHREQQKSVGETVKAHGIQLGHGVKTVTSSNYSRGNSGTRYLDRMKGSFFASSKALSDGSFFGRGTGNNATVLRENKHVGSVDSAQTSVNRRDSYQPERAAGRVIVNGDDKHIHRPVPLEAQIQAAPKKSWHQLFTRSSPVPPPSNLNVIGRPSIKSEAEAKNHLLSNHGLATQTFDNPLNFGLPSLFSPSSFPTGPTNRSTGFSSGTDCIFSPVGQVPNKLLPEEPELFEDPCYTPDPVSLLGPVSESLDNFQLNLGTSFASDIGLEKPWGLKNVSAPCEVSKPSPIESPLSRNRVTDDRHSNSNWYPSTPKFQNVKTAPNDNPFSTTDVGTWQMWNSSPLGQDGLGLIGAGANWFSPPEQTRSTMEEPMHPLGLKSMASMLATGGQAFSGADSVGNVYVGNCHKGGPFTSPVHGSRDPDPWLEKAFFPPLGSDSHFALSMPEENIHSDMTYGSPSASARNHLFEQSSASCWPKKERPIHGPVEGVANQSPSAVKSHVGGLYSTPDVQSLWSYE